MHMSIVERARTDGRDGTADVRRMSPGMGRIRSPIVHSPLVPAFPLIGGARLPRRRERLRRAPGRGPNACARGPSRAHATLASPWPSTRPTAVRARDVRQTERRAAPREIHGADVAVHVLHHDKKKMLIRNKGVRKRQSRRQTGNARTGIIVPLEPRQPLRELPQRSSSARARSP